MSLEEKESDDVRIDYISGITTAVLAIDSGLWAELVWKEDNVLIMKDFLDTPATRLLLIYVDKKDKLSVTVEFPKQRPLSDKCMYFLKYQDIAIPLTNFRQHFMHGSLSHLPLKLHHAIFEQVMMPILCNPQNNVKWPADVYEDIKLHFQDFRKTIYYCVGQANGKTVLPIPETAKQVDLLDTDNIDRESMGDANTRDILDSIGGMVVDWTTLVNEVISTETSGNPLHDVDGQGPLSEIVFWKARKENLEFIFQQINEPVVKKMATLIEKVQSCYNEAFVKLLRNVVENLAEAEDVANCLQILTEPFKKFANCPFSEMKDLIPELIRTVTCSWKSSKYFSSIPSRIGVLVKRICNQVIVKIRDYLDGPNLFHKDRALAEEEIKDAKEILDSFIKSYYDCRDGMESTFEHAKLYPWEFPDERVFSGLHKFIQRLNDIRDLFDAADTYNWIPQFDLRGLQQMELKLRLNGIFEEFSKEYLIFEDSKCDILDLNEEKFQENYLQYQSKIQDLDCRLGTAISQGCIQSTSTSEAYKLMQTFNTLIKRPLVEIGFRNCVPNLIIKVRGELKLARKMYENNIKCLAEKGYCIVYRNTPTIAGNIMWATEVKEKLSASMEALKAMKKYFITENDAEAEEQMYNELMDLLTNYQKNTFLDWSRSTDSDVSSMVAQPALTEGDNGRIVVNYDMRMSAVIEEVRRLVKTELENIPESAIGLNDQRDNLRYVRSVLTSTVSWYNTLCEELVPFEKILISEHWDEIKELLEQGKKMTWKDSGLKDLAAKVFNLTKGVYENVRKTKENINEVRKLIEGWTQHPIYARESPTSLIDLKIYMTPAVRQQYNDVKLASMKMQEKMEENLRLFECNAESQEWLDYLKYLEEVIEEGLKECAVYNLQYLFDNTDSSNTKLTPFTKVQLVLDFDEGLTFLPPMMGKRAGSLLNCFESATDKICEMSEQATRMTNDQETYSNSLSGCDKLNSLKSGIIKHVLHSTANVMEAIADFERYEDLWLISIDDALEDFLLYGPAQAYEEEDEEEEEELNEGANVNLTQLVENPPTEEEFREQISTFELLLRKAEEIEPTIIIDNWLLADLTPFKEDLLLVIRQWIITYREKFMEQKSLGKLRKVVKEELD